MTAKVTAGVVKSKGGAEGRAGAGALGAGWRVTVSVASGALAGGDVTGQWGHLS